MEVFQPILKRRTLLDYGFQLGDCDGQLILFDNAVSQSVGYALQGFAYILYQRRDGLELLFRRLLGIGNLKRYPASLAFQQIQRLVVTQQGADPGQQVGWSMTVAAEPIH